MTKTGETRTSCIRCGTCCRKGSPTLHHEDIPILLGGHIKHNQLVTIRKGELAFDPATQSLRPTDKELIKINGRGGSWACRFLDEATSECTVYEHRPLECRLLKCWDTSDLEAAMGRSTLARTDIINRNDPVAEVIQYHDRKVSLEDLQDLTTRFAERRVLEEVAVRKLDEMIRLDLAIRANAFEKLGIDQQYELFIFGRPLTTLIKSYGIQVGASAPAAKATGKTE